MFLARVLLSTTAGLALGTTAALANTIAVQLSPGDIYGPPLRVDLRIEASGVEPASAYVRGCAGFAMAEGAPAVFDLSDSAENLFLTADGEGLSALIVGTPDGLYRCALPTAASGLVAAQIGGAQAGRYRVWLATEADGGRIDAHLVASGHAVSAIELRGLDVAALGTARLGEFVLADAEPRTQIALAAPLVARDEMRPLNAEYCPGYSGLDAADAVLVLDQSWPFLGVYADSERDLTLAVVAPDGTVTCNDDTVGLNPAVTLTRPAAGTYHVFVGGYSPGDGSVYDLYASVNGPAQLDGGINPDGPAFYGAFTFSGGTQTILSAQVQATVAAEMFSPGQYCAGFVNPAGADVTLFVDTPPRELSLYATSATDLVMLVRTPSGTWLCNDDTHQLNPAVTLSNPEAGAYSIWVGAFGEGAEGMFTLIAREGQPDWAGAPSGRAGSLNHLGEPAAGLVSIAPGQAVEPRVMLEIPAASFEAFALGDGCAGYIEPSRPDLVVSVAPGMPNLMIYMVSDADGTLVVRTPSGALLCNDDFEGLNPAISQPNPEPGEYAVFAGTYGGAGGLATLGVTVATPVWAMDREH
jgi:hypothetical protein